MRDPKLGYHWIWIIPLGFTVMIMFYILWPFASLYRSIGRYRHKLKLYILYKKHPELKELSTLSGVKNER